jgi:ATP-binding cassette, subfamily C, bacteriocin exporter
LPIVVRISKMNLLNECIGTLKVIVVFILGLIKLEEQSMEYSSFMVIVILSYFITALMPKISNALFVMTEGTEAYLQNRARFPEQP